ncbi:Crp/Fnr family transcriptional regulator [Aquabacterium sp.]|uniref:Crp/Fnr family transcriptional regulator n=1 Tax=Aquabacterium sp. TaxID=1872578 RepID=UPI003D6CE2E6
MSLTFDKNDLFSWRVLRALAGDDVPWLDGAEDHIQLMRLEKGQVLFEVGQPHPYLYVVRQGCLKLLYRGASGDEWVQDFVAEGAFFCSLTALVGGLSSYACEALEACELERLHYPWLEETARQQQPWQQALLSGWKDYATRKELRERDLLTLTPPQRYEAFMRTHPGLAQRIPQKDLARYLGVTPVSLSRIRGRLKA